jgi:dephospho-CoA kinase
MLKVAITGGMGAGKSTVRELLQRRGAYGIDADDLARQVVMPGTVGLRRVLDLFGEDLLDGGGRLRRRELARRAFADARARALLEAVLHPLILAEEDRLFAERELADPDGVVVVEVPLLAEAGTRARYDLAVLVTAPDEVRRQRLTRGGRFSPDDAEARMAHQAGDETRAAAADFTIENAGDTAALAAGVERLWEELAARAGLPRDRRGHRRG